MPRSVLLAWGSASDGQLGPSDTETVATPRPFPGLPSAPLTSICAGLWASLIITDNGSAVYAAWPQDSQPSLIPGTARTDLPRRFPPFVSAAVGRDFVLLLSASGDVYALGSGSFGQLGLGKGVSNVSEPVEIRTLRGCKIVQIAAKEFHWLAVDASGRVWGCGMNSSGQLGLGEVVRVHTPVWVSSLWPHAVCKVDTGDSHTIVLTVLGEILAFGGNKSGQCGQALYRVQVKSVFPVRVPCPTGDGGNGKRKRYDDSDDEVFWFEDVACGAEHTVALRNDGRLVCWGKGEHGQLGTRSGRTMHEPTIIGGRNTFFSVDAGDRHSAAVDNDGHMWLWGDGSMGQIGDGDYTPKFVPVRLADLKVKRSADDMDVEGTHWRVIRLVCGGYHNLAIVSDDPQAILYKAGEVNLGRVPKCLVDDMLSAKAGLSRFGSAQVLLRTFVKPNLGIYDGGKLSFAEASNAYEGFLKLFGSEGTRVLGHAAAKIRHEAQIAFGLIKPGNEEALMARDRAMEEKDLVTPGGYFVNDDNYFRSSVANFHECGCLFALAMLNPIYGCRARVSELAELASVLLRCEEHGREAFIEIVSQCPPELLKRRFIRPLQEVLTSELIQFHRVRKNAKYATKALAICYHAVHRVSKRKKLRDLIIPRREFYNETVSDRMNLGEDYKRWIRSRNGTVSSLLSELPPLPTAGQSEELFSFCTYSFLLSESAKFHILQVESNLTMNEESMRSVLSFGSLAAHFTSFGTPHMHVNPGHLAQLQFLVLHVRRDHIVNDAFVTIAELADRHPRELRKPLKVIFHGEDGVDEGGVRKEFYQVLMEQILSPNYGMFTYDEETRFTWFRQDSLESDHSWVLVGTFFGLAAFNSILLDVQFPPVVYRKMQVALRSNFKNIQEGNSEMFGGESYRACLEDVEETFPSIGKSLSALLSYEGEDVEDVFALTFEISYTGLFGKAKTVELIPNGSEVAVTNENREEFASLYIDYLINKSIEVPFKHFALGFSFMLSGPFVHRLSAEELETLVVGERTLDFQALKDVARYEGYIESSNVIRNLWQVLNEYPEDMKRLFLSFVTGTDRAPIGGLRKLVLVIQRAEGDSNRLPTSHTCFNVLLLPEYATRAKLRDRLSTAIRNSKGFGLR